MSTALSIRLPNELIKKLGAVSEETERPRSFHIVKALETYLEDYADLQIALDRLRDHRDPVIDGKQLRSRLGL